MLSLDYDVKMNRKQLMEALTHNKEKLEIGKYSLEQFNLENQCEHIIHLTEKKSQGEKTNNTTRGCSQTSSCI